MSNRRNASGNAALGSRRSRFNSYQIGGVVAVIAIGVLGLVLALHSTGSTTPLAGASSGCAKPPAPPTRVQSFSHAPSMSLAQGTRWTATVSTNCGDIVFDLYGDKAPQTVSSFLQLARAGYWSDSPCQRLTTAASGIYVLQCGDPTGTGRGTPGYGFGIENAPADGNYPAGTLAMARTSDPNSNGGQFFVVYKDTKLPTTGGGYSIFGRVTKGMAIVDGIARQGVANSIGPGDGAPAKPISILKIAVVKNAA
ncbi:MAG: peptidylprolyl isomerase [Nocardioidaceae bacterium]